MDTKEYRIIGIETERFQWNNEFLLLLRTLCKKKKSFLHNALFAGGYYKIAPQIGCLWTQARPPTYTQSEYIIFCQLELHL